MAARKRRGGHRLRGAKGALHGQLDRALAELDETPPLRDISVHEARKELKRARSTLRLLRNAIGKSAYRHANQRLRDAAHPLSRVRDAKVLLDLAAKLHDDGNKKARRRPALASLERRLRRERQRAHRELLERPAVLRHVRHAIESVQSDARPWPRPSKHALRRGIARMYRQSRKAFTRADEERAEEALHESRKRTKYLGQALEVLAPNTSGRAAAKRAKRADAIADALGDDHDLALLQGELAEHSRSGSSARAAIDRIERRREKIQRKAAKRGRRLYRDKGKAFVAALHLESTSH